MKKNYKRILIILALIFIWAFSFIAVYSQNTTVNISGAVTRMDIQNPITRNDINAIINAIINALIIIAASGSVIMIIISGITILTSAGNQEKLDRGKKILKWSLIGVAIVLSATFIIDLVKELLAGIIT